jgi:DNA-binding MarR family transcriptional regulator
MDRVANLMGAAALLLSDEILAGSGRAAGRAGAGAAALAVLAQEPGQRIEQLRLPLGLSQSATVRVVDGLVADGLARRAPGPDGRSVSVVLTPDGRRRARTVLAEREAVLAAALDPLDEDERATLGLLLERVLESMTTGRAHAEHVCRLCHYDSCPEPRCPVDRSACAAEAAEAAAAAGRVGEEDRA